MISATLFSTSTLSFLYINVRYRICRSCQNGYGPQLVKRDLKFSVHASDDWHEPTTKTKKSESSEKSNTRHNPEQYKTQLPPPQLYSIYMYIYIA